MENYITKSAKETQEFGKKLANKLTGVIALTGGLGTGKTTFTQGFAEGLKITDKIISPTFVLMRIHKIPKSTKMLYHIDLYRLENDNSFQGLGLEEIINDENNIVLIEWAEKAKGLLPKKITWINFINLDENTREINIS